MKAGSKTLSSATKAVRIFRPSSVRIGMFCRFGSVEERRPVVVEAIEMGGSTDPQDIRDNLEKITGFVGTGGIFNFSATDHNGLTAEAFEMVVIENGDWTIAQ